MEIKVNNIKMHKLKKAIELTDKEIQVPVVEGKLVLIRNVVGGIIHIKPEMKGYIPIIISATEKIEIGDKFLFQGKHIETAGPNGIKNYYELESDYGKTYKILALPEHFSPKHLQAIVDGKLKDGDKVLVECELYKTHPHTDPEEHTFGTPQTYHVIKLNHLNHITLYPIPKMTIEYEAMLGVGDGGGQHFVYGSYDSIKLLQQKLLNSEKMYTREEVENILQWCAQRLVPGVASNYGKRELEHYEQNVK